MRHNYYLIIALSLLLWSCGDTKVEQEGALISNEKTPEEQTSKQPKAQETKYAIALWKTSITNAPGADGKWVASMVFGEKTEILADTTIIVKEKEKKYIKVKLSDKKEGWVNDFLMATDAKRGVVVNSTVLYGKPDILAIGDKTLDVGELVAIYNSDQEDWIEVAGFKKNKKGWVKSSGGVSSRDLDLTLSVIYKQIEETSDETMKAILVDQVINDEKNNSSVFYDLIREKYGQTNDINELDSLESEILIEPIEEEIGL